MNLGNAAVVALAEALETNTGILVLVSLLFYWSLIISLIGFVAAISKQKAE